MTHERPNEDGWPSEGAEDLTPLERWRLVLGQAAGEALGEGSSACEGYDSALSFLYDRQGAAEGRGIRGPDARRGSEVTRLTAVRWLDAIHRLFPRRAIERLERDAVERYAIEELVTDPELLARVEPDPALLRAVLRTKHRMDEELLRLARRIVRQVVERLREQLRTEVRAAFGGSFDRRRSSARRVARNLDLAATVRRNLQHYDARRRRLLIERPSFVARTRRHGERWQVILLADQSGSMLGSAIWAAITASCFVGVPGLRTHLLAFDTSVVDLSGELPDPVEVLMKAQLGGGTDISAAVAYASRLVANPRRTLLVLVSDLFEGGDEAALVRQVGGLCEQGVKVLALAALDEEASPTYDRELARRLLDAGASVGAMTPGELAAFVARTIR